ncbi:uncharacterized protein METZ01_LOCUS154192, partial [marine metagenome]
MIENGVQLMKISKIISAIVLMSACPIQLGWAQGIEVPERADGEGQYERLVLRGGYIIDGTGSPA